MHGAVILVIRNTGTRRLPRGNDCSMRLLQLVRLIPARAVTASGQCINKEWASKSETAPLLEGLDTDRELETENNDATCLTKDSALIHVHMTCVAGLYLLAQRLTCCGGFHESSS